MAASCTRFHVERVINCETLTTCFMYLTVNLEVRIFSIYFMLYIGSRSVLLRNETNLQLLRHKIKYICEIIKTMLFAISLFSCL